jgi:enoyl-CoA hydratase/carnithine racemase
VTTASGELAVRVEGSVAVITLNRPERRNALTRSLLAALADTIAAFGDDAGVSAIVLSGAGTAFCSGADLDDARASTVDGRPIIPFTHGAVKAIRSVDKPVVAAVNGAAVGMGLALALAADIRVVADDAPLSEGYIKLPSFPGGGDVHLLPALVGTGRALEMMWTGEPLTGRDAVAAGLAQHAVPAADVHSTAVALAGRVGRAPGFIVGAIKRATYRLRGVELDEALEASLRFSAECSAATRGEAVE